MYKVSVIVPVYKVEAYIEKCLHSLFGQTLKEIEYIFIDDCTPDRSIDIIHATAQLYPERNNDIRIISQPVNQGVAAARTLGMQMMTGEYMAHCDADDWIDLDAYATMYDCAKEHNADMVTCLYLNEPDSAKIEGSAFSGPAIAALRQGAYTYGLWDKIIKASIIQDHNIYPYPGINYNEDLNVIMRALCYADRVANIPRPLYHHLAQREGSICNSNYETNLMRHSVPSMALLDKFLDTFANPEICSKMTTPLKFWMKSGLYTTGQYDKWRKLWPESNLHLLKIKSLTAKERLLMLWHCWF